MNELERYFESYIGPFLKSKGFEFEGLNESSYRAIKRLDDVELMVSARCLIRPKGVIVELPMASIVFPKISVVLTEILHKHDLTNDLISIRNYNNDTDALQLRTETENRLIRDDETFLHWRDLFITYWTEIVNPFFIKYSSIHALREKIAQVEKASLSYWFGGYPFLKKLLLMKLGKNPAYRRYEEEFLEHHNNIKNVEDGRYLNYYRAAIELHERLEAG
jgi:hypothetical protein